MSAPPDENNLKYGWLAKAKFEADKARKEKKSAPWSKETWQAAGEAFRAGVVEPERRFPIIITSSTGPFPTPQKLQEVAGLQSLPDVQLMTMASWDDSAGSRGTDSKKPEEVRYCEVNLDQLSRVKEYSDGKDVLVWFQGKRRFAWLAHSVKQKSGNQDARSSDGKS